MDEAKLFAIKKKASKSVRIELGKAEAKNVLTDGRSLYTSTEITKLRKPD